MLPHIHKAGLLVVRQDRVLLCRKKKGTQLLILPGGKLEAGETAQECLLRELLEELDCGAPKGIEYLGTYTDRAATADPTETAIIRIELFRGDLSGTPVPRAEIAELVWFGPDDDRTRLAPSLRNTIFPELIARGILPWDGAHAR